MNTQVRSGLSSDKKIDKVLHAYGYSIPVRKDGRRMWPTKLKQDMAHKIRTKELTVKEISITCKTDQFTVNQWRREYGKNKPVVDTGPSVEAAFTQLTVSDDNNISQLPPADIAFRYDGFELKLPSDYPSYAQKLLTV